MCEIKNISSYILNIATAVVNINPDIFSNNFFKLLDGSEYRKPTSAIDSADAIAVLCGMLEINEVGDSN